MYTLEQLGSAIEQLAGGVGRIGDRMRDAFHYRLVRILSSRAVPSGRLEAIIERLQEAEDIRSIPEEELSLMARELARVYGELSEEYGRQNPG